MARPTPSTWAAVSDQRVYGIPVCNSHNLVLAIVASDGVRFSQATYGHRCDGLHIVPTSTNAQRTFLPI